MQRQTSLKVLFAAAGKRPVSPSVEQQPQSAPSSRRPSQSGLPWPDSKLRSLSSSRAPSSSTGLHAEPGPEEPHEDLIDGVEGLSLRKAFQGGGKHCWYKPSWHKTGLGAAAEQRRAYRAGELAPGSAEAVAAQNQLKGNTTGGAAGKPKRGAGTRPAAGAPVLYCTTCGKDGKGPKDGKARQHSTSGKGGKYCGKFKLTFAEAAGLLNRSDQPPGPDAL